MLEVQKLSIGFDEFIQLLVFRDCMIWALVFFIFDEALFFLYEISNILFYSHWIYLKFGGNFSYRFSHEIIFFANFLQFEEELTGFDEFNLKQIFTNTKTSHWIRSSVLNFFFKIILLENPWVYSHFNFTDSSVRRLEFGTIMQQWRTIFDISICIRCTTFITIFGICTVTLFILHLRVIFIHFLLIYFIQMNAIPPYLFTTRLIITSKITVVHSVSFLSTLSYRNGILDIFSHLSTPSTDLIAKNKRFWKPIDFIVYIVSGLSFSLLVNRLMKARLLHLNGSFVLLRLGFHKFWTKWVDALVDLLQVSHIRFLQIIQQIV